MIFCNINQKLVELIKEFAKGRTVVDCGAGEGMLGKMMPGVISLELFPDIQEDPQSKLVPIDCRTWPFDANQFPVFIRPCHSGFPGETIMTNLRYIKDFFYVSKDENMQHDLHNVLELPDCEVTPLDWVGDDGEQLYYVVVDATAYDRDEISEYFLVDIGYSSSWMQKITRNGEPWFVNSAGGGMPCKLLDPPKDSAFVDDDRDLDWSRTGLLEFDEDFSQGWLSPDGNFYQAAYNSHDTVAYYVIRKEVRDMDKQGWVKLQGGYTTQTGKLTYAQSRWLEKHGFDVYEHHKE